MRRDRENSTDGTKKDGAEKPAAAAADSSTNTATTGDAQKKQKKPFDPRTDQVHRIGQAGKEGPAYTSSIAERTQRIRSFIQSLKFTVPLKQLRDNAKRTPCGKCGRQRLFYCYDCLVSTNDATRPPKPPVLPANVHVVLHPKEHRSKSTSLPAATIAPGQITVHTFPEVPDLDPKETVLLYPSATAVDISELPAAELDALKNVVFIDSTWQQSKVIEQDAKIQSYRHVKIPAQETLFWRFQDYDPTYLATVEAIYYTLVEVIKARNVVKKKKNDDDDGAAAATAASVMADVKDLYHGEVDDLLLYYIYQYILIQTNYNNNVSSPQQQPASSVSAKDGAATAAAAADNKKGDDADDDDKKKEPKKKEFTERHFKEFILEGLTFDDFVADAK